MVCFFCITSSGTIPLRTFRIQVVEYSKTKKWSFISLVRTPDLQVSTAIG